MNVKKMSKRKLRNELWMNRKWKKTWKMNIEYIAIENEEKANKGMLGKWNWISEEEEDFEMNDESIRNERDMENELICE